MILRLLGVGVLTALVSAYAVAAEDTDWQRAILTDRMEVIRKAVLNGQNINLPTASGKTALMSAVKVGDQVLVDKLIDQGADANAANAKGGTVLMYAMLSGDTAIVERVLAAGAKTDALTTTGWSAMMIASAKNYAALIDVLLRHGADANQQDVYGWTPLIRAAHEGYRETVERLLESEGVNVTLADERGLSALHHAAMFGHVDIVTSLLEAGADPRLRDANGKRPGELAEQAGHKGLPASLYISDD